MEKSKQFETIEPLFYFAKNSRVTGKRTKDSKFVVFAGSRYSCRKRCRTIS